MEQGDPGGQHQARLTRQPEPIFHNCRSANADEVIEKARKLLRPRIAVNGRFCSLIPGFCVKLSAIILAGPTVLSAVGACPPHDGVRRRWWINVASAVSLMRAGKKSGALT